MDINSECYNECNRSSSQNETLNVDYSKHAYYSLKANPEKYMSKDELISVENSHESVSAKALQIFSDQQNSGLLSFSLLESKHFRSARLVTEPNKIFKSETHRFGCQECCSSCPHDLASCPAFHTIGSCKAKDEDYLNQQRVNDPFFTLRATSGILAFNETDLDLLYKMSSNLNFTRDAAEDHDEFNDNQNVVINKQEQGSESPLSRIVGDLSTIKHLSDSICKSKTLLLPNSPMKCVITVPVGMTKEGPVGSLVEVVQYPSDYITTFKEKKSYINDKKKHSKKKKSHRRLYLENVDNDVKRFDDSRQLVDLEDFENAGENNLFKFNKQYLHSYMPDSQENKNSKWESLTVCSETSNLSDLSGYENEYLKIKQLVSFAIEHPEDNKEIFKLPAPKVHNIQLSADSDIVKDIHAQKEELEIQLHRLAVQVETAVHEKELYHKQLEILQTEINDASKKEIFEIRIEKSNLEGQLEMKKHELENIRNEKHKLEKSSTSLQAELTVLKDKVNTYSILELDTKELKDCNEELQSKLKIYEEEQKVNDTQIKVLQSEIFNETEKLNNVIFENKEIKAKLDSAILENECLKAQLNSVSLQIMSDQKTYLNSKSEIAKLNAEISRMLTSLEWHKEQLENMQSSKITAQNQIKELKDKIQMIISEKEALQSEVNFLKHNIEENMMRVFREKAELLAHLEGLKKDNIPSIQRDNSIIYRLENKLLEDTDVTIVNCIKDENDSSTLQNEVKFYKDVSVNCETEVRELKSSVLIKQELLSQLELQNNALQHKSESLFNTNVILTSEQKKTESVIAELQMEKLSLQSQLNCSKAEKIEVNKSIEKVKDEMNKVSCNYNKMKYDLSSKDKVLNHMITELDDTMHVNAALKDELNKANNKNVLEMQNLQTTLSNVKATNSDLEVKKERLENEVEIMKKTLKSFEIEKKNLNRSISLHEEQMQNVQGSLDSYREMLLKKDEDIFLLHEQITSCDRRFYDLQQYCDALRNDLEIIQEEKEDISNQEKMLSREINQLKESIYMEKQLKFSLEKKQELLKTDFDKEKSKLIAKNKDLFTKLTLLEKEMFEKLEFQNAENKNLRFELNKFFQVMQEKDNMLKYFKHSLANMRVSLNLKTDECDKKDESATLSQEQEIKDDLEFLESNVKKFSQEITRLMHENNIKDNSSPSASNELDSSSACIRLSEISEVKNHSDILLKHLQESLVQNLELESRINALENEKVNILAGIHSYGELGNHQGSVSQIQEKLQNLQRIIESKSVLEETLKKDINNLKEENTALKLTLQNYEGSLMSFGGNWNVHNMNLQLRLKELEEERDKWKSKYTKLQELIPEKDTNSELAISLQEPVISDSAESLNTENLYCVAEDVLLQVQLTSKDWQAREDSMRKCIIELKEALNECNGEECFHEHFIKLKDRLQKLDCLFGELVLHSETEHFASNDESNECRSTHSYAQQIKILKHSLYAKDKEFTFLQEKLNALNAEFQQKQQCYETSIRLLTKKLKEHIKGRRSAEKDLENCQDEQTLCNAELEHYEQLKKRCLELESHNESFLNKITKLEHSEKSYCVQLEKSQEEVINDQSVIIDLQKEVGKMKELQDILICLKEEISILKDEKKERENENHLLSKSLSFEREKVQESLNDISCLNSKFNEKENKLRELTALLADEGIKNADLEDKFKKAKEELLLASKNYECILADCNKIKDENDLLLKKNYVLDSNYTQLSSDISALYNDFSSCKIACAEKDVEINVLKNEIEKMKYNLEEKEQEFRHVLQRNEKQQWEYKNTVSKLNNQLSADKEELNCQSEKLVFLNKEKCLLQKQIQELRESLNAAILQIKEFEGKQNKLAKHIVEDIPSPKPLNMGAIKELLQRSAEHINKNSESSLDYCLKTLKAEVSALQKEMCVNSKELGSDESCFAE